MIEAEMGTKPEEGDKTGGVGCEVQQGSQQKPCVPVSPDALYILCSSVCENLL